MQIVGEKCPLADSIAVLASANVIRCVVRPLPPSRRTPRHAALPARRRRVRKGPFLYRKR
ncbi:hypothetical protein BDK92_1824 [Micromonospora pisi]|uniref:Uncharacterized protein n=1 Tax=Micromonospora pisi TaxID=589240 RepID=A0A495JFC4_9ACTN|nr:hypothetical protein BDK92_1824 [Micromonospora pisi]